MRQSELNFHQRCILSILAMLDDWESWAGKDLPASEMARRKFHQWCIRFVKGIVKSWRLYLVETAGDDLQK